MKHFIVLSVCAVACVVKAQKDSVSLPPAVIQTAIACLAETGVNPEILPQLISPKTYEKQGDKRVQRFINCTFSKAGYAKKNGRVRIERVLEIFPRDMDVNKRGALQKVMEECNKANGGDVAETTYNIFGCFVKNSPVNLTPGM